MILLQDRKARLKVSREKSKRVRSGGNQSKPVTYLLFTNI